MKYRLLSFASIVVGLVLSLILVRSNPIEATQASRMSPIPGTPILQGTTVLTAVLLLTGLCIATNRLLRVKRFWKTIRYFSISAFIIYIVTQILAFLVGKLPFLPSDQIPDISRIHNSLSVFGLNADTWSQMQNTPSIVAWGITFSQLSTSHYVIWLIFACAIAFVMLHDTEVSEPTYNLVDSVSRLIFRLLQNLFALLSIYLVIHMAYMIWCLRGNTLLTFYAGFLTRLVIITTLLFLITPLILSFVYKDKKAHSFLPQGFLSIFTSFLTGSAMFSMGTLIIEQKNRLAISRNTAGLLNPLNLLFLRPGSAIVLAYSFITYYSSNTRWQLNFFPEVFWLIIVPIGFSILIGLFSIPNYFTVLPFYFVLFGLGTTDTFVIMVPVLLLGQSFANCIDLLSWNLSNYIYDRFYSDISE
ncbi:cation:dicarboxylase symporter family transporter [Candidatus Haliotispira prima]|uniref:Cation:dicarboxylase symporter family transporter n=1 Tax=Candidatus Haliotispira prima TaxID=3034016 RepID=A0ABY8MK65_9SPIO|nr:cation:dicarboxylase symporter family transporter [Candidatus Haliotispira prima]